MNNVLLYFGIGCAFSFIFKLVQDFVFNEEPTKIDNLSGLDLIILTITWPYWLFRFLYSYIRGIFETK
jgi:hypothetical protein